MSSTQLTTILFYGRLADMLGPRVELPAAAGRTVAEVREQLAMQFPAAAEALKGRRVRACIDDSVVPDSRQVGPGEQVEFLPPVSGG